MSKLARLEISNVKRIKYALVEPDGNTIVVGGLNAQGKSSLIDAIEYVYGGKRAIPEMPLRKGAKKGFVAATDDNGVTATRSITPKGTTLAVTDADGNTIGKPQEFCDSVRPAIHFDPLAFASMERKARLELVKDLAGLDFTELNGKQASLREERTIIGREAKKAEGYAQSLVEYDDAPKEEVTVPELLAELDEINAHNADVAKQQAEFWKINENLEDLNYDVDASVIRINDLKSTLAQEELAHKALLDNRDAFLNVSDELAAKTALCHQKDDAAVREKIDTAEDTNIKVRANAEREVARKSVRSKNAEYERLGREMEEVDEEKNGMMEEASFPLEGLSFSDDDVLFNDLPLEQASSAELLKISVAIGIALAPNPEMLQVMLIRDGSLLDTQSRAQLSQMAMESGLQCWMEVVGTDGDVVLDDGVVGDGKVCPF